MIMRYQTVRDFLWFYFSSIFYKGIKESLSMSLDLYNNIKS